MWSVEGGRRLTPNGVDETATLPSIPNSGLSKEVGKARSSRVGGWVWQGVLFGFHGKMKVKWKVKRSIRCFVGCRSIDGQGLIMVFDIEVNNFFDFTRL